MGWSGDINQILSVLSVLGADQDEQGNYLVRGNIISFMGIGPDCVVDDEAEYRKGGDWCNLVSAMGMPSYGVQVTVIA